MKTLTFRVLQSDTVIGILFLAFLQLAFANSVLGQANINLTKGAQLRITAPKLGLKNKEVTITEVSENELILESGSILRIHKLLITKCEVKNENKTKGNFKSGFGIGLLAGTIAGAISGKDESFFGQSLTGLYAMTYGLGGALLGGLIGSGIRTPKWEKVWPHKIQLSLEPELINGLGVGLVLRF